MESTLAQQKSKDNQQDFIAGDVVCITEAWRPNRDNLYVFEGVVDGTVFVSLFAPGANNAFTEMLGFCVSIENIRTATVAELHAKRRLTKAEQALAEVS